MFKDRKDAGERLAKALDKYRGRNVLVLAIPKGGIEVAFEVARYLATDFSLLISRKLPYLDNPEAGFGAIAEDGSSFIFPDAIEYHSEEQVKNIKKEQTAEIKRRIKILRQGKPLTNISGRTVILIDDGLAMGSTMRVAIMLCRKKKAKKIIVAVPVSGKRVAEEIGKEADEFVVLETPIYFQAVAQVYENWHDVSDNEAIKIMNNWQELKCDPKLGFNSKEAVEKPIRTRPSASLRTATH